MPDYEEAKERILSITAEIDSIKSELSASMTNLEDVKSELDEVLRTICMADLESDADRMMAVKDSKAEMERQKWLNSERDF